MSKEHEIITRSMTVAEATVREAAPADGGAPSRTIEGYAIVFGAPGYPVEGEPLVEYVERGAVTEELLARSDIRLTLFHNPERLLARSREGAGTLHYSLDERGVRFSAEMPNTADGDFALESVRRGDIAGCSFMCGIKYGDPECVEISRVPDGSGGEVTEVRIRRIAFLRDFTLTDSPAYPDTEVVTRAVARRERTSENPESETEQITNTSNQNQDMPNPETIDAPAGVTTVTRSATVMVREALRQSPHRAEFIITRAAEGDGAEGVPGAPEGAVSNTLTTSSADGGGLVPLRIQNIIDDVAPGVVYDKAGIPLSHNNSGEFLWPVWSAGSCYVIGEKEKLTPSKLDISKLTARPERMGVMFEVTYESLYQSDHIVEDIVYRALALAVRRGINTVLMSPVKAEGSGTLEGPLVAAKAKAVSLSKAPTFKELNGMKARLLSTGLIQKPVWVMSPATMCELEATPKDAGSGIMCVENGTLCGYPVFVSDEVTDEYIALGDWVYQPSGFFGEMRLIVDPYSQADANVVRFILNFGFATKTVRPEAFVVGKKAKA